ncbi:MAG: exosortase A [Gammaproteobacteria bacterium]
MSVSQSHQTWRRAVILLAALLVLVVVFYQQTVFYLLGLWNQLSAGDYGHGYLVLAISGYLIFYNRHRLSALSPEPEYRAIPAVIFASVLWMLAALVDIAVLQVLALLLLLLSIVWASLGNQVTRMLVFPVLYIGFALPFWYPLSPLLQAITADTVFWAIRVLDVPAYRIENTIVLPAGRLSIEESCSGLRYLLASLTLGTLYAYLNYATLAARLAIVLVFAATAVLANILRVFIVVYLGYTSDMQHPLVYDHLNLGWYLFAGLIFVLLIVETLLQRKFTSHEISKEISKNRQAASEQGPSPVSHDGFRSIAVTLIVAFLIVAAPLGVYGVNNPSRSANSDVAITFPADVSNRGAGNWSVATVAEDGWQLDYHGATVYRSTFKDNNNRQVHLYLGLYTAQRQGEELINELNRISDNKAWRLKYKRAILYNAGERKVFEQLLESSDGSQRLVWYWYSVAGHNTVNKYQAKGLQVLGLLQGNRRASVVAIASKLDAGAEDTRKTLKRFVTEMGGYVDSVIDDR